MTYAATRLRRAVVLGLVALSYTMGGCQPERSTIITAPDGVRTFTVVRTINGQPTTCGAVLASKPHVRGVLRGDPNARPEPVWLEGDDGRVVSVVWPEGFYVTFEPEVALFDSEGRLKASAGDVIELNQTVQDHAGTYDDPYFAQWFIDDPGCYLYRP